MNKYTILLTGSSNPFKSAATSQLNFDIEPFGLFNNNGNGNFIIPEASFDDDFFSPNPFKVMRYILIQISF